MSCVVLVDESGEAGIAKVRTATSPGSSPYFVLSAAVVPEDQLANVSSMLKEVEDRIPKKWVHATDLTHSQTVFWARSAARMNVRFFSVISNKSTLDEYAEMIRKDPDKFYNKCAVYLLEKVGKYLTRKGLGTEVPTVVFEKRNHDYDAMRRFIGKIKGNPLHSEAEFLKVFNPFAILAKSKEEEPLLKYADLVAHATYQLANKTRANFDIPEARYFEELAVRFGADSKGTVLGNGLKCIHSLDQLNLDKDVEEKLRVARALPMKRVSEA